MKMELPELIADYFAADGTGDAGLLSELFADDAVVRDEGHTIVGREAIRDWKTGASSKYSYTVEPFAIADSAGRQVVTSHVTGDFPGGSLDLRYFFVVEGGQIVDLEIVP